MRKPKQTVRPEDSLTFAGLETCDEDRAKAAALSLAEDLTARLRSPGRDISERAGEMERRSPLFIGTGENPCLW